MAYANKAEVVDPRARTLAVTARKTMYCGKLVAIALMAFAISALSAGSAVAAEIRVLALQSPQIVMAEVGAEFERKTGHTLTQLLRRPDMDIVGDLVARGEADIGVTAISTLLATPGVEVVGPLPQEIQSYVYFEGGVATNASAPNAARALLKFLTERSTVRVIKSKGMEPW